MKIFAIAKKGLTWAWWHVPKMSAFERWGGGAEGSGFKDYPELRSEFKSNLGQNKA